jgi:hypothetical protein
MTTTTETLGQPHRDDVLNYEHFDCCGQGMVPATARETYYCRHCNQAIRRIEGDWTDPDSCVVCPANMASLTAPHQPVCPPSAVADMIVRWDELQPGDLFVYEEGFVLATETTTYEGDWQGHKWMRTDVTWRQPGDDRQHSAGMHSDRLVAVRRYQAED